MMLPSNPSLLAASFFSCAAGRSAMTLEGSMKG